MKFAVLTLTVFLLPALFGVPASATDALPSTERSSSTLDVDADYQAFLARGRIQTATADDSAAMNPSELESDYEEFLSRGRYSRVRRINYGASWYGTSGGNNYSVKRVPRRSVYRRNSSNTAISKSAADFATIKNASPGSHRRGLNSSGFASINTRSRR